MELSFLGIDFKKSNIVCVVSVDKSYFSCIICIVIKK